MTSNIISKPPNLTGNLYYYIEQSKDKLKLLHTGKYYYDLIENKMYENYALYSAFIKVKPKDITQESHYYEFYFLQLSNLCKYDFKTNTFIINNEYIKKGVIFLQNHFIDDINNIQDYDITCYNSKSCLYLNLFKYVYKKNYDYNLNIKNSIDFLNSFVKIFLLKDNLQTDLINYFKSQTLSTKIKSGFYDFIMLYIINYLYCSEETLTDLESFITFLNEYNISTDYQNDLSFMFNIIYNYYNLYQENKDKFLKSLIDDTNEYDILFPCDSNFKEVLNEFITNKLINKIIYKQSIFNITLQCYYYYSLFNVSSEFKAELEQDQIPFDINGIKIINYYKNLFIDNMYTKYNIKCILNDPLFHIKEIPDYMDTPYCIKLLDKYDEYDHIMKTYVENIHSINNCDLLSNKEKDCSSVSFMFTLIYHVLSFINYKSPIYGFDAANFESCINNNYRSILLYILNGKKSFYYKYGFRYDFKTINVDLKSFVKFILCFNDKLESYLNIFNNDKFYTNEEINIYIKELYNFNKDNNILEKPIIDKYISDIKDKNIIYNTLKQYMLTLNKQFLILDKKIKWFHNISPDFTAKKEYYNELSTIKQKIYEYILSIIPYLYKLYVLYRYKLNTYNILIYNINQYILKCEHNLTMYNKKLNKDDKILNKIQQLTVKYNKLKKEKQVIKEKKLNYINIVKYVEDDSKVKYIKIKQEKNEINIINPFDDYVIFNVILFDKYLKEKETCKIFHNFYIHKKCYDGKDDILSLNAILSEFIMYSYISYQIVEDINTFKYLNCVNLYDFEVIPPNNIELMSKMFIEKYNNTGNSDDSTFYNILTNMKVFNESYNLTETIFKGEHKKPIKINGGNKSLKDYYMKYYNKYY